MAQLDVMRWDLDGDGSADRGSFESSYTTAFADAITGMGCPSTGCSGYELSASLDFDTNGSGTANAGDDFWNGGSGWEPIGTSIDAFSAAFDGNFNTVSNLFVDRAIDNVGLFGYLDSSAIVRNVGLAGVHVESRGRFVGALVGQSSGARVAGSSSAGSVKGHRGVGGLVGTNLGGAVVSSSSAAAVVGDSYVGGLVGSNSLGGSLRAVYATGTVDGTSHVGGLVGWHSGSGSVEAAYAIGAVRGTSHKGGLIGRMVEGGSVVSSYWNTQTSGQSTSAGGTGHTTTDLTTPTDYSGIYANWNIDLNSDSSTDDPWNFGTNTEYPDLRTLVSLPPAVPVVDDDEVAVVVSVSTVSVGEGASGTYTVELGSEPAGDVVVEIASDNSDVTVGGDELTFTDANWNVAQTVEVSAGHDGDAADDTATLTHAVSSTDDSDYDALPSVSVAVTVTDDENAQLVVSEQTLDVDEGGSGTYTVELSAVPTETVTVEIASDNSDVTVGDDEVEFTVSDWSVAQTVEVAAGHDDTDTANDTATLTHTAAGGAYEGVTKTLEVAVADDDEIAVVLSQLSLEVGEGASGTYTVELGSEPAGDVVVEIASDNSDVTVGGDELTFTDANWNVAQTVEVSAGHDGDAADDTATLTHAVSSTDDSDYDALPSVSVAVTVTDDENAQLVVSEQTLDVDEGGSGTYTVELSAVPTETVTVEIASDNSDVTVGDDEVEFTVSDWSVAQTVEVAAGHDDTDTANDTATLTHTAAGGAYEGVTKTLEVAVADDDEIAVVLSQLSLEVGEGASGTYTVELGSEPAGDVVVEIASDNSDVTVGGDELTFTDANWNVAQTVEVSAGHDGDAADDTATLTHAVSSTDDSDYDALPSVSVAVTVTDDDAPDAVTAFPNVAENDDDDAGDGVPLFVDVVEGAARDAVESLAALVLFDGTECEPGRFCPGRPLQRWEAAVWLVRLLDGDEAPGAGPGGPGDGDGVWWMPYVERLAELGVVMCSEGTDASCLDGSMTRGEAAGLLVLVFGLGADADDAGFVDVEESGDAAAINALAEAGITKGCVGGDAPRFCTQSPLSRRHMALFLYGISQLLTERNEDRSQESGDGVPLFVDVVEGAARDAVESLAALVLFDGTECEPGRFCPGRPLQRWEAAVWLVRLLDGDEAPGAGPGGPGDGDGVWWMPYVERLAELGVVMCSEGTDASCLDGSMTRGEAAGLLVLVFGLGADADDAGFVDVEESGDAAAINALAEAGITKGCVGGDAPRFCTQSPLSRRHMALFLYRISQLLAEVSGPDERPRSSTQLQTGTRPSRERSALRSRSIVVIQRAATILCPQFNNCQVCL